VSGQRESQQIAEQVMRAASFDDSAFEALFAS
jgi:hypothetical protein